MSERCISKLKQTTFVKNYFESDKSRYENKNRTYENKKFEKSSSKPKSENINNVEPEDINIDEDEVISKN